MKLDPSIPVAGNQVKRETLVNTSLLRFTLREKILFIGLGWGPQRDTVGVFMMIVFRSRPSGEKTYLKRSEIDFLVS